MKKIYIIFLLLIATYICAETGVNSLKKLLFYIDGESSSLSSTSSEDIYSYDVYNSYKDLDISIPGSLSLFNPTLFSSFSSEIPKGGDDGALFQGRGFNFRLQAGLKYSSEYVDISLIPELWGTQNLDFETIETSRGEYQHLYTGLDQYQRPGGSPLFKINPGNSSIKFKYSGFDLSLTNELISIGSAVVNPIMLSSNAAGIPRINIGYSNMDSFLGSFEIDHFWGLLTESEFYDSDSSNDNTMFTFLTIYYRPSFFDSLTLGFNRSMTVDVGNITTYDYFKILYFGIDLNLFGENNGSDLADQRMSLTFDLDFKDVGFQLYGELAKNDYSPSIRDIILTPEHTLGFTLGLTKVFELERDKRVVFLVEISDLIESRDYGLNVSNGGTFYRHHAVSKGYSNEGQLLGASMGTGSDSQYVSFSVLGNGFVVETYFQRVSLVKDFLYKNPDQGKDGWGSTVDMLNIDLTGGVRGLFSLGLVDLFGEIAITRKLNHNYEKFNDLTNVYCSAGIQLSL